VSGPLRLLGIAGANAVIFSLLWWVASTPLDISPIAWKKAHEGLIDPKGDAGQRLDFARLEPVHAYSRPLFSPDRRPWEPPPPPPAPKKKPAARQQQPVAQVLEPPPFRLVGVSIPNGAAAKALLRRDSDPEPGWVAEGGNLEGWIVEKIDLQSIVLQQNGQSFSIDLYPEANKLP
jgi:hypothetical protein